MKNVLARRKKDRSYSTEYKRYCRFIEANGLCSAHDESNDYLHWDAVDSFFFDAVNRGGQKTMVVPWQLKKIKKIKKVEKSILGPYCQISQAR
jgi:hypothetical protein